MYQLQVIRLQKILGKFTKKNKVLDKKEEEIYQKIKRSIIKLLMHHAEIAKSVENKRAITRREPTPKNGKWILEMLYDDLVKNYEVLIDKDLFVSNIFGIVIDIKIKQNVHPQLLLRFPN